VRCNALVEPKETSTSRSIDAEKDVIQLSPREQQVLKQLQQGQPNKVIARKLNICISTVKVHVQHIMKKLNARNRTQVVLLFNRATTASVAAVLQFRLGLEYALG
jgi:DNA-binding NarL/FixJ family response regulator